MYFFTIAIFFACTFFLGFTASSFAKNSDNFLERNIMRIGFGLSLMPFLGVALNIARIPADWRLILALSAAYPLYYAARNFNRFNFSFRLTKSDLYTIAMLALFAFNFYIYLSGAFSYPYLDDDDSWAHAFGVKYVSMGLNVFAEETKNVSYINPYPPAYDMLLGILRQTNDSVYWTMKFFNALIIALSTIFFYFFVKELSGSKGKALFAAFALVSIPAFMSHFIWALSIAVPLYFVAFYALEMVKHDKKWWVVAGLVMVTVFTSTPTHSTYFGLLFICYIVAKSIAQKKPALYEGIAGVLGATLSFAFWWMPMIVQHGLSGTLKGLGIQVGAGTGTLSVGGTGDKAYAFKDFFFAQNQNMINNPIGIGIVLFLLLVVAMLLIFLKYRSSLGKNKMLGWVSIAVLACAMVFLLFLTYTKTLWADDKAGPIPFNVFISDQMFLVVFLIFSMLALISLVTASYAAEDFKDGYLILIVILFILLFYSVNAAPFKFKLSPFRAWMLLAIPVCILAAEGASGLMDLAKKISGNAGKYVILALLVTGVYFTSTQQKIAVNTAQWPPGAFWTSGDEIGAYVWMHQNLQKNSHVFTYWNDGPVIGMDMYNCHWCPEIRGYMKSGFNQSAQQTHDWLKSRSYQYIIIDGQTAREFGAEAVNIKIKGFAESGLFRPVFQNSGAVILKV